MLAFGTRSHAVVLAALSLRQRAQAANEQHHEHGRPELDKLIDEYETPRDLDTRLELVA